jgi:uncharacterized protein (TIGR03435 family)
LRIPAAKRSGLYEALPFIRRVKLGGKTSRVTPTGKSALDVNPNGDQSIPDCDTIKPMKLALFALGFTAASTIVCAQGFEVAAIKVIDQRRLEQVCQDVQWGRRGGPGTESPGRVEYKCQPLQLLVLEAFGFAEAEGFRMPNLETKIEWTNFVNVSATVPPQTSVTEYRIMLRNLLAERYNLKSHDETREGDVYELSILPSGYKLRPHVENLETARPPTKTAPDEKPGADGLTVLTPIPGRVLATGKRDHFRLIGSDVPIQPLAERFEGILHAPVVDRTGLNGKFDFQLDFDPGAGVTADGGVTYPMFPSALRDQLGLSIKKTRGSIKVVIVDSIDPRPSEN